MIACREFISSFPDPLHDGLVDCLTWQEWLSRELGHLSEERFIQTLELVSRNCKPLKDVVYILLRKNQLKRVQALESVYTRAVGHG